MVYLEGAPAIKNVTDPNQCIKAREHFGYDAGFINDKQICEDIHQFRFAKDFNFLEEFFDQKPGNGSWEALETVVLDVNHKLKGPLKNPRK